MSKITTITTDYSRKLTVSDEGHEFNLAVKDTDGKYAVKGEVYTHLDPEQATKLANALMGGNATIVTDLPEVEEDSWGDVTAVGTGVSRTQTADPERILHQAKALLAIHAHLVKAQAEREAAKAAEEAEAKAKEAQRTKRRDELTLKFRGFGTYAGSTHILQQAIDYAIDLEEAAKVS